MSARLLFSGQTHTSLVSRHASSRSLVCLIRESFASRNRPSVVRIASIFCRDCEVPGTNEERNGESSSYRHRHEGRQPIRRRSKSPTNPRRSACPAPRGWRKSPQRIRQTGPTLTGPTNTLLVLTYLSSWERECWLSSHATIVALGLVKSAENADPADTSGFDRFAAQGTALSALIAFAG